VSNLVRLVDPEEIAAARHSTERELIFDSELVPEPADDQNDQNDATQPASPTKPRSADPKVPPTSAAKTVAGRGTASCYRIAGILIAVSACASVPERDRQRQFTMAGVT
jgi:hypothetical protein